MSMGWDLHLRTTTNGPIVHPPGDMWAWRAMLRMMLAEENSWLVHQSSLTILPAETSQSEMGGMDEEARILCIISWHVSADL
jgi:hypothetical protein